MKKNSWKTLLSVLLLLALLVSMLPFAAFAEDGQTAAAQTEEPAKTEDVPKVEEKTGDTPKADGKTDAAKTDEKSGDTVKDESKDVPKDDAAKDGSKDAPKDDAAKDENKDTPIGDTEQPAKGSSEDAAPKTVDITLTYDANGGTGSCSETKTFNVGEEYTFTVKPRFDTGIDRAKHAFLYWTIDKDGERDRYNGNNQITVTGDTTLYAQWQYVPQKINILYSPNYSSIEPVVSEPATEGESYPVLGSNTFRPPYNKHFVNWNTASDGSGTPYEADSVITAPGNDLTLYAQWADDPKWSELGISVTAAPENPTLGETITYTVTVTNNTGLTLSGITINNGMNSYDSLSMLSLQSSLSDGWALTSTSEGNLCNFYRDLAPGASSSYKLTTSFINADNKTATCTAAITSISADGRDPVNGDFGSDSATAALKELDWSKLTIEKKVDKATAQPGETLNYTITVTNNTGCDLSYICVKDTFPSCIQGFSGTDSNVKWKYTTRPDSIEAKLQDGLKAGTNAFFSVEATLTSDASGTAVNTAQITEAKSENYTMPSGAGNSATATTSIERAPGSDLPGLTISVTPNTSIADINQEFTYTVEITNNTGKHLKIVRVSNGLPTGVERLGNRAVEGSWHLNTNSSTAILSANLIGEKGLPDGTSASYNVNAKFSYYKTATTATNKADIYEVRIGNDITSGNFGTAYAEVYSLKNLTIEKTVDKSTAKPGDTLTYTVEVTNNTDTDLDEVYVEDSLPGTLAYTGSTLVDGAAGTLSHDSQLGTVTAKVTGLKKGAAAKYTVTAKVNADASGEINSLAKITKAVRGTDTADITTTKEASAKTTVYTPVPVNVTVLFNGLKDVSQVPAGYKLTGADSNTFLKGEIALGNAEKDTSGQISRTFTTTADVLLGQEYSLNFTQSGYNVPGYICAPGSLTFTQTPTAGNKAINAVITLDYTKENLYTYPSATVRTYFKGLAKLPDSFGYNLNCVSAPEDAIAFQGPLALTPGTENGVPYLEFSAKNVTLQAGTELTFSFTQSGYDVPGYLCALGSSTFKFTLPVPTTDVRQPILLKIENTYTQPDWSKLTITKTADKTSATPGSVVNYTVTVTNNTGVDLRDIIVADKLDSRLRYSDSTGDYDTGTGTWTVASLANGKSVTLTLTAKLKYALAAGTVIENTASVTEAAAAGLIYDLSGQRLNDSVSVTVTSGKGAPQTGDESNLGLWGAVMAASLVCAGAAAVIYKKRRG